MDRQPVDIIHTLSRLEWKKYVGTPKEIYYGMHNVCLQEKVYLGGGHDKLLSVGERALAKLYIYIPATDTWDTLDTPVYNFALTTYRSKLVLVGGREYVGEKVEGRPSNKLWTLSEDGKWEETLPPMETACDHASAVSHGDHLLVIDGDRKEVLVYNGQYWAKSRHDLPERLNKINSSVHPHYMIVSGSGKIYYASMDSLIASSQPSETSQPSTVWKSLPDAPVRSCSTSIIFGTRQITIGNSGDVYAYFHPTQSWVKVGCLSLCLLSPHFVVLPSNELMVISKAHSFKVTLNMTPYHPDSPFNIESLSKMEACGIPVMSSLNGHTKYIKKTLGISRLNPKGYVRGFNFVTLSTFIQQHMLVSDTPVQLLADWLVGGGTLQPTWTNLLWIIRELHLNKLADEMLKKINEKPQPTRN